MAPKKNEDDEKRVRRLQESNDQLLASLRECDDKLHHLERILKGQAAEDANAK